MVISQPPGNNPSYYYRASPTLPQLLWMLPETPYVLYMQLQHQLTHRNGAIKHIFYTNQIHGGIISRLFFIHFVAPCACSSHLAVKKYYFKSFCMKIWARWPYIHLSVVFPSRMLHRTTHFVTQPILLSENIPNIWHKSSSKHKEVRPDWNDKNDNANYAPSYHMEEFYQWLRLPFLKKYSIKCERFRLWIVYSELKRHNVSHYIYYLATDNIHIVLENDNTVLIKGLKKVVNVKFSMHLMKRPMIGWNQKSHFSNTGKILLKQEFSDGLQISMNIKDITIPLIIHYYLLSIQNTTQIFPR